MPRKDKEQSDRFIKKAKELGADESGNLFERAIKKIVPPIKKRRGRASKEARPKSSND